ncbi:MAG: hypothetical protein ACLQMF_12100 [Rectinemataceae bacterium]
MKTGRSGLFIVERGAENALADDLHARLLAVAAARSREVESIYVGRDDIPPCIGCLECMTKHPGSCLYDGAIRPLSQKAASRFFVVLIASSSFGAPSSPIKNVMDRGWLIVEPSSRQIVVGCGEDASVEEASTFVDIVARHRGAAEVIHTRVKESIEAHFSRSLEDNALISGRISGEIDALPSESHQGWSR